jgi:alanine dehydrogenase
MKIGLPKEIKPQENRVGLTPASVAECVAHGHEVFVEQNAGHGIFAPDSAYLNAGAKIVPIAADIFEKSELIVKVKEPQAPEWAMLKPHHTLFTYLHLAPDPIQAKGLMASGATAIAYETVTDTKGGLPLLTPMSEIAGRMAPVMAATHLMKHKGGLGSLMWKPHKF